MVSLNDLADRPPVPLSDGQVLDLGHHKVRHIDTPHVPHAWEARVLYEETTNTLLCGDLFTQLGDGPALTSNDIVEAAGQAEDIFGPAASPPTPAPTIRRLAELAPSTLAVMHGTCFSGDGSRALHCSRRRLRQPTRGYPIVSDLARGPAGVGIQAGATGLAKSPTG